MGRVARSRFWLNVRHLSEYVIFRLLLCVWQSLSPAGSRRLARNLAWGITHLLPRQLNRYEVARDNLRLALGSETPIAEIDRIIEGMWRHLFQLLGEIAVLPRKLHNHNFLDIIEFRGKADAVRLLLSDRPVLFLSGHFGNWEMAVSLFGTFGFPMGVVARDLDNPYLHNWFARFRQATGHQLIAKQDCFDDMLAILEQGGRFARLGDQDAGRGGIFVDYFGTPASTLKTIGLLAQQYQAVICVGCARRVDVGGSQWERFCLEVDEIIDPCDYTGSEAVLEMTQRFTTALERAVRQAPEQYFWLHRRWRTRPGDREARRKARKKAA